MKQMPTLETIFIEPVAADAPDSADAPSTGAVTAVVRALQLLEAFGLADAQLSLAELSRRTGLHKTTVLRLARTLAQHQYMVQNADGSWRLGRAVGWLGACYQAAFDVHDSVEPVLRELTRSSGESASFYVREGHERICLLRVEGPQAIRHHVRVGAAMPLNLGAPGRVILAFCGEAGEPYEAIRSRGFHTSIGERDAQVASVAAPIFGRNWQLLGSICISGPAARLTQASLEALAPAIMAAANRLSYGFSGKRAVPAAAPAIVVSRWHP